MNFSLTIFDCDGTLVDSEPMHNLAVSQLLAEEGLGEYAAAQPAARFVGTRFTEMLQTITKETGHVFPPDMGARYVARVAELSPRLLHAFPGAFELVEAAMARGEICMASNGQRDNVLSSLEITGLKKYFPDDDIFTAIQVERGKPAPDLFLLAAKTMGAPPAQCMVIEDSIPGVMAGRAAGMRTLAMANPHLGADYAARLKDAGADEIFTSLIHIRQAYFS